MIFILNYSYSIDIVKDGLNKYKLYFNMADVSRNIPENYNITRRKLVLVKTKFLHQNIVICSEEICSDDKEDKRRKGITSMYVTFP